MLNDLLFRLRSLFRRRAVETELNDELRFHFEKQVEKLLKAGLPREEARRRARLELGGLDQLKEECREARGVRFIETLAQDIRYGLRILRKSPGFAAVAILILALGIGANTAIFSLIDSLVFRPLPVNQPSQLAFLLSTWKNGGVQTTFSYPNFLEIRKQTDNLFSDESAMQDFQMDGLSVDGTSEPMWASYVAGNFFNLLGITPAFGRFILPSEGRTAGADPVLVLSYAYWKSRFGDPAVIGKKALVNGHPVTIVGIAPEGFHGLSSLLEVQGYMPLGMAAAMNDAPADFLTDPKNGNLELIGRLRSGVNLDQVEAALQVAGQRLAEQEHEQRTVRAQHLTPFSFVISPEHPEIMPLVASVFLILAAAVLALACMNIANLCLIHATARQREISVRAALGAGRSRLIRQLLTESLLLASLGCIAGIFLGIAASRLFSLVSFHTALPLVLDFHFSWRVFAYALAAAALTVALVGIAPALRAVRADLNEVLHEGGRTSTGGRQRLRSLLVVAQVGGSLMLLVIAGLFVRSLEKALAADLGFDPQHLLNLSIDPHEAGYDAIQARRFQWNLLHRAGILPGVESASLSVAVPMSYNSYSARLKIDGYETAPGQKAPAAGVNFVSPDYFRTMRIPLLRGRDFRDSDDENAPRVAIVSEEFADRYWHGLNPIGRRFSRIDDPAHSMEVIGISKNSYAEDIFSRIDPFFYEPLAQHPNSYVTLQLRTASAPETLASEATRLIHSLEPAMPVFDVHPMTVALETANGFLPFRLSAALAMSLGILGLILAIVGVYGVISYAASQRTHEIGIRMALGAQRSQILNMILRQGVILVCLGLLTGILAAAAMAKLVGNLLFGVPPVDILTYAIASLLLTLVALIACYLPARRAMRVDPMVALRYE